MISSSQTAPCTLADEGRRMHRLVTELFPICRSLTGEGVRQTLRRLREIVPLEFVEVPSGTRAFDWTVPKEWAIREAYIATDDGRRVVDFQDCTLHVVGYSTPVDARISRQELDGHLHSLEDDPDAIPYATSYYKEQWGFCLSHRQRLALLEPTYQVRIDSELFDGYLTYGELVLPGTEKTEVLISTNVCHPSMANNELSGPVVAVFLARWLMERPHRHTYRFVFLPETIGSLVYLSRHLEHLRRQAICGFVLSCVGDERRWSMIHSRTGNTYADKVLHYVLTARGTPYTAYPFLERGSDERQYCSPGVDLPVVTFCRSKFGEYPEYHTSRDDLTLVTPAGLAGSLDLLRQCVDVLEHNATYRTTCLGEPQLGKRGLYPSLSTRENFAYVKDIVNFLAYADGNADLLDIGTRCGIGFERLKDFVAALSPHSLVERLPDSW